MGYLGWFWMGSLYKNIQLMLEFLKGLFLVLHFSCYRLITFLMMLSLILLSMLMILLSTLYSDLWQQLELVSELQPDLGDIADWGRKWVFDFNAQKNRLVLLITPVPLMWKWKGCSWWKILLRYWGWLFLPNWIWALTWSLFLKVPPKKRSLESLCEVSFSWGCSVSW